MNINFPFPNPLSWSLHSHSVMEHQEPPQHFFRVVKLFLRRFSSAVKNDDFVWLPYSGRKSLDSVFS